MTLAAACLMLHDMGHVATCLHRDHLCLLERSHTWSECSAAPHFAFSASDVAELATHAELYALIVAKLRASQASGMPGGTGMPGARRDGEQAEEAPAGSGPVELGTGHWAPGIP